MIKKIILGALIMFPTCIFAQKFSDLTLKNAQDLALAQNKIILVDASRPGVENAAKIKAEKDVLELPGVKELLDKNLIAIRVDMFSQAGKEFAPMLQMNMYPTYAFIMPNGDLLGVVSPFAIQKNTEKFVEALKMAIDKASQKRSNTKTILFENISYQDALAKAAKEDKLIFIDAITENCQPCMKMAKDVFTLNDVADFYNTNFIPLKINLPEEQKDLVEKFKVDGYPTYLFINSKGELVKKYSGFTEPQKFISYGKDALKGRGIYFTHGTWKEILDIAAKENKPIFVDCYTVWCGPCKQMANTVFKEGEVAEYFNSTFINVKIDMEKGEGIDLKNKFKVNAFPTFLYLNPKGEELNRIVGGMPGSEFLKKSKSGISENGLATMNKRYQAGERSEKFIFDYLETLGGAYMEKDAAVVVSEYFKTIDNSLLDQPKYWKLFLNFISDCNSEIFKYVYKNREHFYKLTSKSEVDRKLFMVWSISSREYIKKDGEKLVLDEKGFNDFIGKLKSERVEKSDEIILNAKMFNAERLNNWNEYITLAQEKIKVRGLLNIEKMELYNWGLKIDQNCTDIKLRKIAAAWYVELIPEMERIEAKSEADSKKGGYMRAMSMVNYVKEFKKLSENLSVTK